MPGIVGYGKAVELAMATMEERAARETQMRDYLMKRVMDEVPFTRINGSRTSRLPNLSLIHILIMIGEEDVDTGIANMNQRAQEARED